MATRRRVQRATIPGTATLCVVVAASAYAIGAGFAVDAAAGGRTMAVCALGAVATWVAWTVVGRVFAVLLGRLEDVTAERDELRGRVGRVGPGPS